jgi:hypothetical protein
MTRFIKLTLIIHNQTFFKFFCEKPYKGHDIMKSHFESNEMA